jgi:hypothetical protein
VLDICNKILYIKYLKLISISYLLLLRYSNSPFYYLSSDTICSQLLQKHRRVVDNVRMYSLPNMPLLNRIELYPLYFP